MHALQVDPARHTLTIMDTTSSSMDTQSTAMVAISRFILYSLIQPYFPVTGGN